MFIHITASETGNNKGSSGTLVSYLEKENRLTARDGVPIQENWFNGTSTQIPMQEVRTRIDGNTAKLGREDSKFFLINISPSQKELAHLQQLYGEQGAKHKLKEFAIRVMDEYARNFKRPGITSNQNLLWYGKYENYRHYRYTDPEVKQGSKQKGARKEGRQGHIQIIVSRKDITNRLKLSPQNTSRGKNQQHSARLGQFNRTTFKQSAETLFDREFNFDRGLRDTLKFANTMKNGTAMQKTQMQVLDSRTKKQSEASPAVRMISAAIAKEQYSGLEQLLGSPVKSGTDLLMILLQPSFAGTAVAPSGPEQKRRKKKKGIDQSQGLER